MTTALAPDEELGSAIAALAAGQDRAEAALDALAARYPEDPRLHFMKGSILAGCERRDGFAKLLVRCKCGRHDAPLYR